MIRIENPSWNVSALPSILLLVLLSGQFCRAQDEQQDLSSFTLEQLTHIEISAASRQAQELFKTPAAVYVITREDIERSGATSVPELLRMVPGLEVAQVDANKWAVSARGFNSRFANKMLIMIDERTIFNPAYSGVLWDQNDLTLESIDRIEIIRGPGGTMWGANAVNGVINIVTKRAGETHGITVAAHAGKISDVGEAGYGWRAHPSLDARLGVKLARNNDLETVSGGSAGDHGAEERIETRLDWKASDRDHLNFQGALFRNPEKQIDEFTVSYPVQSTSDVPDFAYGAGGYAISRWEHKRDISDVALQGYFSEELRREAFGLKIRMQTIDLDYQHHLVAGAKNDLIWGAGYRWVSDFSFGNSGYFAHDSHFTSQASAFFQDSYALVPAKVILTAGTKLLWNTYTHFEVQPRVSFAWTPNDSQTVWLAVSRAVRIPSDKEIDLDFTYPIGTMYGMPMYLNLVGNKKIPSEVVLAYEGGYRHRFGNRVTLDVAGFVNHYTNLNATQPGTPYMVTTPSYYLVEPVSFVNGFATNSQGIETTLGWSPAKSLRFRGSYTWMEGRLKPTYYQNVFTIVGQEWNTPRNTFDVRAYWDIGRYWKVTATANGVSAITSGYSSSVGYVPQYTRADLRLTRKVGRNLEFSAAGTNLTDPRHKEFYVDNYVATSYIPRAAYFELRWAK